MLTPDHTHLTFGHHKAIIAALALLPQLQITGTSCDQSEPAEGVEGACKSASKAGRAGEGVDARMKLLVVGLGGGALPMFINKCIPNVSCCGLCQCHDIVLSALTHMRVLS